MRSGFALLRLAWAVPLIAGAALLAQPPAGDWPQWRGPGRDGAAAAPFHGPVLPAGLTRRWQVEVGGGYSGPVVAGDRVWVHSRQGGSEVVRQLRLDDGAVLWARSYPAPFRQDDDALGHGLGPYATPTVDDGRLFTFGVRGVLSAWDADTGELLWTRSSEEEFEPAFPYFGAAASPLVWNGLCFVHLGGHPRQAGETLGPGAMVALRVADGHEAWRWDGDGPALGASPVVAEIGGRPQLVFKTQVLLVGLEAASGRELWRTTYRVPMINTIVTPLVLGDRLVTSDYDIGFMAWRIEAAGGGWALRPLWRHRQASLFNSSPVVAGGLVVGFSHLRGGQLVALDPADGRVAWRGPARAGEHATLLAHGDELLVVREDGTLLLAGVSRAGLRPIVEYRLGRAVAWSHPAVAGDRLVFRDGDDLALVRLGG